MERLKKAKIINLGESLNTKWKDYNPTVSGDGLVLFFGSDRDGSAMFSNVKKSHDIWVALKKKAKDKDFHNIFAPPPIDANVGFNTSLNESPGSISADNKVLYFVACNRPDGYGNCDIYAAYFEYQEKIISLFRVENLGSKINGKYFDSYPSISPDNKTLYFVSNRHTKFEGSYDFDIYFSKWDELLNEWGEPVRMSNVVNTPNDDRAPFICPDNKTLIFASNGHPGSLGGLDNYYTTIDSLGNWAPPVNLGAPFNTGNDEMSLTMNATGELVYFYSDRKDIPGFMGDLDIFQAFTKPLMDEMTLISWQQFEPVTVSINIYDENDSLINTIDIISKNKEEKKVFDNLKGKKVFISKSSFEWDCKDMNGELVPPGKYFYEVVIQNHDPEPARPLLVK